MNNVCSFSFVLAFLVCVGTGGIANAATYYVSTSGNNANACSTAQSVSTPKLTISQALECLAAGDTLVVRGGTYPEQIVMPNIAGTSWSSPIRIQAAANETVWLSPTTCSGSDVVLYFHGTQRYIEFTGINIHSSGAGGCAGANVAIIADSSANPHHIRFQDADWTGGYVGVYLIANAAGMLGNNEFLRLRLYDGWTGTCSQGGLPGQGLYIQSSNNLFDGLDISEQAGSGFQVYNGAGHTVSGTIIRNSKIHDITFSTDCSRYWGGTIANGSSGTQFYNNLIYNVGGATGSVGLSVFAGSGAMISNNTIYGGSGEGLAIEGGVVGTTVRNNISYGNRQGDYRNSAGASTTASNNLFTTDPRVVSAAAADFQLQTGSPAIDAGTTAAMATDLMGTPRPQGSANDIGAYEYRFGQGLQAPTGIRVVSN